jgi:hypothetical protein
VCVCVCVCVCVWCVVVVVVVVFIMHTAFMFVPYKEGKTKCCGNCSNCKEYSRSLEN